MRPGVYDSGIVITDRLLALVADEFGELGAAEQPLVHANGKGVRVSRWIVDGYGAYCDGGDCEGAAAGSFSIEEPANSFLPSASTTELALPTSGLFLARWPVTVTVSPIFIELRFQPRRMRPFGLASSKSQFTILPWSSFASM